MRRSVRSLVRPLVFNRFTRRILQDAMHQWFLPRAYKKAAKQPVIANKVVFVENTSTELSDNFRLVHEELVSTYDVETHVSHLGFNSGQTRTYYRNCLAMVREIATASYVFLNDASSITSCVPVRHETRVAQLWHACGAFKKFGMSTADLIFGGSRKQLLRRPFYQHLDLVTVSSPEVVWAYTEAMVLEDHPGVVQPLGISRTDVFFDPVFLMEARSDLLGFAPQSANKKVLLYAPTFRGRVLKAEAPDELDIRAMRDALGDDYLLLIKHHPFVKEVPAIPEGCEDFAYVVGAEIPIDKLLAVADVCISDYSSVVFEFSLFERPMIFFAFDQREYDDWRGFYYPYDELTPGPVVTTTQEIIDHLLTADEVFDPQVVREFKEKYMSACDGQATSRILDAVVGESLRGYEWPRALNLLSARAPEGKDVSVIIPAHNAMPELGRALEGIVNQSYPLERIEVVVVDDGSSDDSWAEIERYVASYPEVVVAQRLPEASGSPAVPRNVGLDVARGEYVFFLDADDWLGPRAIGKMLDRAVNWNSDVLYVKMVGANGRVPPRSMFTASAPLVDVLTSKVLWSLAPLKLFRRSLIEENGFRFTLAGMPEDQSFSLGALFAAEVVSVAADYGYYFVSWRDGEAGNTSPATWNDLDSNIAAFTEVLGIVRAHTTVEGREVVLLRRLFERDVFNMFVSLVTNYPPELWGEYGDRIRELFGGFFTESLRSRLSKRCLPLLDAGFAGDDELIRQLAHVSGFRV